MPNGENTAIIVAAGSGSRFGGKRPKQFLELEGKEVLAYSVDTFFEHPDIQTTVIVCSHDYHAQISRSYPDCRVVEGGATRQDSVHNGLAVCPEGTGAVLVHDAARPLIPQGLIDACLSALDHFDGVAPVIEPSDSMIFLEDDRVQNLERDRIRIVQTPQCFRYDILRAAHAAGLVDTDEIGLVRQALPEASLTFVSGHPMTMKITSSRDLEIIRPFLNEYRG